MTGQETTSLFASQGIIERGKREAAARDAANNASRQANIALGQRDVLRSFVFHFYHHTMVDTHLSGAYHKYGAESPQPEVKPLGDPGYLGGGWHNIVWEIHYDNIVWRAQYTYRMEGWALDFWVLGRTQIDPYENRRRRSVQRLQRILRWREWIKVHTPAQVAEALS